MSEELCPICQTRPRRRNKSRRLQATCGEPACVRAATGSQAGRAAPKTNYRPSLGAHRCGDDRSLDDGYNGHYTCGGIGDAHVCVQHSGWHDPDRPEPFRPDLLRDRDAWMKAWREAHPEAAA